MAFDPDRDLRRSTWRCCTSMLGSIYAEVLMDNVMRPVLASVYAELATNIVTSESHSSP